MAFCKGLACKMVEEELPLKQGLKPSFWQANSASVCVEEELPLKQGLKQIHCYLNIVYCFFVEEELPLKQGLKRSSFVPEILAPLLLKRNFH